MRFRHVLRRLARAPMFTAMTALGPVTYAVVSIGLFAAVITASYIPAMRVMRVDPVEALRAE